MSKAYSRPPPTPVVRYLRSVVAVILLIAISCAAYVGVQALIAPASTFICGKQIVTLTNKNTYSSDKTDAMLNQFYLVQSAYADMVCEGDVVEFADENEHAIFAEVLFRTKGGDVVVALGDDTAIMSKESVRGIVQLKEE